MLLDELRQFNPDLVDKPRVLAITKCDMLDDELLDEMRGELPEGIEALFISSVTGQGLTELKDVLWRVINDESNRIPSRLTHRDLPTSHRDEEEDNFIFENEPAELPDDIEEVEWDDEYWPDRYDD